MGTTVTNRTHKLILDAGARHGVDENITSNWSRQTLDEQVMLDDRPAEYIAVLRSDTDKVIRVRGLGELALDAIPATGDYNDLECEIAFLVTERDGAVILTEPFGEYALDDSNGALSLLKNMGVTGARWIVDDFNRVSVEDLDFDRHIQSSMLDDIDAMTLVANMACGVLAQSPEVEHAVNHREPAGDGELEIELETNLMTHRFELAVHHTIHDANVVHAESIPVVPDDLAELAQQYPDWCFSMDFGDPSPVGQPAVVARRRDAPSDAVWNPVNEPRAKDSLSIPDELLDNAVKAALPIAEKVKNSTYYEGNINVDVNIAMRDGVPDVTGIGEDHDWATVQSRWDVDSGFGMTQTYLCGKEVNDQQARDGTMREVSTAGLSR